MLRAPRFGRRFGRSLGLNGIRIRASASVASRLKGNKNRLWIQFALFSPCLVELVLTIKRVHQGITSNSSRSTSNRYNPFKKRINQKSETHYGLKNARQTRRVMQIDSQVDKN